MLVSLISWFKMLFMCSYVFPSRLLSLSPLHPPRRRHCGALSDCSTTSRQQGTDGMCQGHRQDGICQLESLPFTAWHQHRAMRCPMDWRVDVDSIVIAYKYNIYIWARSPDPHTPPLPPNGIPPPLLVFACYLHIYIHIYTYTLPFPPLQPRISTLFAALESHDLINGPCLPVNFYQNLFFDPPIACLAHGLQHICYLWITQSLPMQT